MRSEGAAAAGRASPAGKAAAAKAAPNVAPKAAPDFRTDRRVIAPCTRLVILLLPDAYVTVWSHWATGYGELSIPLRQGEAAAARKGRRRQGRRRQGWRAPEHRRDAGPRHLGQRLERITVVGSRARSCSQRRSTPPPPPARRPALSRTAGGRLLGIVQPTSWALSNTAYSSAVTGVR
ncbi:hypothetical protein AY600_13870 [Phormidium willei BDU 130791]|nr:hypothetical protein AY600_13870 [Phormidium willei BDU 130791]